MSSSTSSRSCPPGPLPLGPRPWVFRVSFKSSCVYSVWSCGSCFFLFFCGPQVTRQVFPLREFTSPSTTRWRIRCSQNHMLVISRFSLQLDLLALALHPVKLVGHLLYPSFIYSIIYFLSSIFRHSNSSLKAWNQTCHSLCMQPPKYPMLPLKMQHLQSSRSSTRWQHCTKPICLSLVSSLAR